MTTASSHEHNARGSPHREGQSRRQRELNQRLDELAELARTSMYGPTVLLTVSGEDVQQDCCATGNQAVDETCRERLLAAAIGAGVDTTELREDTGSSGVIGDVLSLGPDQPQIRWVAARVGEHGLLVACDHEPWEPDERVIGVLLGFASLIEREIDQFAFGSVSDEPGTHVSAGLDITSLVVESSRDGIIGITDGGECQFVNEAAANLLGRDPDSLVGVPIDEIFMISSEAYDDGDTSSGILHYVETSDTAEIPHAHAIRGDESTLPVDLLIVPHLDAEGERHGGVMRFTDLNDVRQSQARHQDMLDMTLDSVITVDQQGAIIEFNRTAEQAFRYAATEVTGRRMADLLVTRSWRRWFADAVISFAATGHGPLREQRTNITCLRVDGSSFPAEIMASRLPSRQGWTVTLYIHDLTDKKWNERRRMTRYRVTRILAETDSPADALPQVLEAVCEGLESDLASVWMREPGSSEMRLELTWHRDELDPVPLQRANQGRVVQPGAGFLGSVWVDRQAAWISDLQQPNPYRRAEQAQSSGFRVVSAMPIVGRTEVIGVIELLCQRPRERDPEMLRMLDSLGSQIGQFIERKRVEEERIQLLAREQSARTEAEAAERRLAFLAEASAQFSASLDYEVTLANVARLAVPKLADYCSINMQDESGQIRLLEFVAADPGKYQLLKDMNDRYPVTQDSDHPVVHVLKTSRSLLYSEVDEQVLRILSGDDDTYLALLRDLSIDSAMFVPLMARGRSIGVVSFLTSRSGYHYGSPDLALAQEIARRAALAIDNARLYREARDAVRVREEFLSIASHELKTPLTTVKGYSQILSRLLRREHLDRERLTRLAQQLQDQLGRFETLIADLLDISRIQQGRLELRPEPIDLVELARTVINRFMYHTEPAPDHEIHLEGPESIEGVWDPDRLDQVLTNLLSNAVKYSPDGGGITVRISMIEDDHVQLSVIDHGIGIPDEEQDQLFRPFARSETVQRAVSGVGLGLFITSQIVKRHGGSVWLDSKAGTGSTFSISLPRIAATEAPEDDMYAGSSEHLPAE